MSNEQKLREALRETLLFCETFSNRWDGETGAHPFGMVERARQALATTEPEPTGMPEFPPLPRCMYPNMQHQRMYIGNVYTADQMRTYGEQCWKAGYKHGAWGDKPEPTSKQSLQVEPAVNQQLTTELDEREAFTNDTKDALMAGRAYAQEALIRFDDAYDRHPSTETERNAIITDIQLIDAAMAKVVPVGRVQFTEVDELGTTARGTGGFGSTGV